MRRIFYILSVFSLFFTSFSCAKIHTDKTFLMPRSVSDNMAMEYITWHTQIQKTEKMNCGGSLQIIPFYQKSENKSDLGKYFGYYAENENTNRDYISVDRGGPLRANMTDSDAVWAYNIVHLQGPDEFYPDGDFPLTNLAGKIKFEPNQEVWGVDFFYYQNLDVITKGLYLQAKFPVAVVKNNLGLKSITDLIPVVTISENYDPNYKNLYDFFSGKVENLNVLSTRQQQALTYAKSDGSKDKTGVSDIDLKLGYYFWNKKDNKVGIAIDLLIPTGNSPKGEYLFEPVCGNGNHWALGGSLDTMFTLWKEGQKSIKLSPVINVKYLFDGTERRTLGFKDVNDKHVPWGHYLLGGKVGEKPLFPLANVLTQDLKVTPGWQLEGILNLAFKINKYVFDIGYNLFAKESEGISLKNTWANDTYGVAAYDFETTNVDGFQITDVSTDIMIEAQAIQQNNLDLGVASTPSQVTHKIYGGIGRTIKEGSACVLVGFGGSYEFAQSNSALEGLAIWTKVGVTF